MTHAEQSKQTADNLCEQSPINWQLMEERCLDAESLKEILPVFIESNSQSVSDLQKAWDSQDKETLCEIAHTIKGSAANIGAEALSQAALLLEQGCRNDALDDGEKLIQEICHLHKELQDYISGLS